GDLFVSSSTTDAVLRYDGTTGALVGVFASGGGLDKPASLTFGPGGDLFVISYFTDQVMRYDGTTGAVEGVVAAGGGPAPASGLAFSPGGDLFVSSSGTNKVLRYDGTTGAYKGVFVTGGTSGPFGSPGVRVPFGLAFGPGGDLFVSGVNSSQVWRYDGTT